MQSMILATAAIVLAAIFVLVILTKFDQGRTKAWLRLDLFTPAMRRIPKGQSPSYSWIGRGLRKLVPRSWQSDHTSKRRGLYRKTLRRMGITWLASPFRRIVQSICLLTFLVLFFYVCWPYDASPLPPPAVSAGWTLQSIDQDRGEFVLQRTAAQSITQSAAQTVADWPIQAGQVVVVFDAATMKDNASDFNHQRVGRLIAQKDSAERIRLSGDADPDVLAAFLSGSGQFDLYERDPTQWPSHYADKLKSKQIIAADFFLLIDPLVSLSTSIASRSWIASLGCAAAILIVCLLVPRGFCGYVCPLGTTIDLFDWAFSRRTKRFRVSGDGWWVHIKYYLLAFTLIAAACGVLVSGFVSAIPVVTRAMLFIVDPLQNGIFRAWHLVPAFHFGQLISIAMFAVVLVLGFLRPRFWCKYVCPSGAIFSIGNLFRLTERKVESSCIHCNKCVEICPFDAIKPDFTTRTSDCTMCQTCGGVCPTHAIKFVERSNVVELKIDNDPPTNESALGRRGFLSLAAGSTAAAVGGVTIAAATRTLGANLDDPDSVRLVRAPGSVPEASFLEMCIRCGECFKACPNNVLQPEGFQQGLAGLWTPMVNANWAGCESSCNACGQVCPTGAIRAIPMEEKRVARMGLAVVNETTCLPFAGLQACDLCVQECDAAGYHAIEFSQVGMDLNEHGQPIEGTGFLAPIVLSDRCVGCGLCQTRCVAVNVKSERLLDRSAIIVQAGEGKEDRLSSGSYLALRQERQAAKRTVTDANVQHETIQSLPSDSRQNGPAQNNLTDDDEDPFGVGGQ